MAMGTYMFLVRHLLLHQQRPLPLQTLPHSSIHPLIRLRQSSPNAPPSSPWPVCHPVQQYLLLAEYLVIFFSSCMYY